MKSFLPSSIALRLSGKIFFLAAILFAFPGFSQKNKFRNDSIAIRDSIKEMMFQGALLSMDALQAKYESQKRTDPGQRQQKACESQNLFFQSRAYYRRAIFFDNNYFPAWSNMGTTYYMQDLPKAAIPCYRQAIHLNNDYSPAWYNLGKAYDMLGRKDSADYSYRQCIRSDSSYVQAYEELSRMIMSDQKDSAAALKLLRLAFHYKSDSDVPLVSMSVIYFSMNDSANGISALTTAAWIYPGDIQRLQNLCSYYTYHKDLQKAEFWSGILDIEKKKQEFPIDPDAGQ
ncbi:MAG TPA: tetratricopeptide repeat protein [Bacteroidia bacterium]|nr:tetratricopeptide repeat protein [Bacteroidia bacterium]